MSEPKFGEWRPVGVAPCNENVLVIDKQGIINISSRAYNDNWAYICGGGAPTHWMPLPPPPKEEWVEAWLKSNSYSGSNAQRASFKEGFEAGRK